MKTVDEWYQKFATQPYKSFDVIDLIRAVREEAFERAELEAYRAGAQMGVHAIGEQIAERIAKIYREAK